MDLFVRNDLATSWQLTRPGRSSEGDLMSSLCARRPPRRTRGRGGVTGAGQARTHDPRPNDPHGTHYNLAQQQRGRGRRPAARLRLTPPGPAGFATVFAL